MIQLQRLTLNRRIPLTISRRTSTQATVFWRRWSEEDVEGRGEGMFAPAPVAGIALNTWGLDEATARAAIAEAAETTGLPATDVVRFGSDAILDAIWKNGARPCRPDFHAIRAVDRRPCRARAR